MKIVVCEVPDTKENKTAGILRAMGYDAISASEAYKEMCDIFPGLCAASQDKQFQEQYLMEADYIIADGLSYQVWEDDLQKTDATRCVNLGTLLALLASRRAGKKAEVEIEVDVKVVGSGELNLKNLGVDILKASPNTTYEEVMLSAIALKRSKEGSQGDSGHYPEEGYKRRGLIGNFVQMDKKFGSVERMIWGPNAESPTSDIAELSESQLKKLFDHLIDNVNYSAFMAEQVAELAEEKYDADFMKDAIEGRELA